MGKNDIFKNAEGYPDPTAYEGIKKADKKPLSREKQLIMDIRALCNEAGFDLVGRVAIRDRETGRLYR